MKSKISIYFIVFFMAFFMISCQGNQEQAEQPQEAEQFEQAEPEPTMDLAQVRQAIEANNLKFGDAVRMGDASVLAALYTEDAKILPPNSDMITGSEGIQAFWAAALQMGIKDAVLTTVDVLGMGDLACEIGKYNLTIQPEGQDAMEDNGKYIVIWKKTMDGSWKLHIDIWNTSMPAQ
jgi:uncharacterized protein (TIGR02246 family)